MATKSIPSKWSSLTDLSRVVKQLTHQNCVKDLEEIFNHIDGLQATISAQDTTIKAQEESMMTKTNELIRLEESTNQRIEQILNISASMTRKKDDEKSALQQALSGQERDLNDLKMENQDLKGKTQQMQMQLGGEMSAAKELGSRLDRAKTAFKNLKDELKEQTYLVKIKEETLQAESNAHNVTKSESEQQKKRCNNLEAQLQKTEGELRQIETLAPQLVDNDTANLPKDFQKLWNECRCAVQACFQEDSPASQLEDFNRWKALQNSNLVTWAVPLPPTNSPAAKCMRVYVTLAILADLLVHNIFTSTYLFSDTVDIDNCMLELAELNPAKEALFRRCINSISDGPEDEDLQRQIGKVIAEVTGCVEPLLDAERSQKLKSDLENILVEAAGIWRQLRKRLSHFAVERRAPSDTDHTWKTLGWDRAKNLFLEHTTKAPKDALFLLFPRIFMVEGEDDHEIFPGVILLKEETRMARDELDQFQPASPTLSRTGTYRSSGSRRSTGKGQAVKTPFLVQNGS